MNIRLSQIRSTPLGSPPDNPRVDELYLDNGANTKSGIMGWRMYSDGIWVDIGLQGVGDIAVDGGTF